IAMGDFATYDIQLSETGRSSRIVINGQDISNQVLGIEVAAEPGMPTTVTVHTAASCQIAGLGVVVQRVHEKAAFINALKSVNAKDLDKRAMDRAGWGSQGTLTDHVLTALMEML